MRDILKELTTALEQGRECVFCSLVETRGSTPQKAGAAMIVFPDGSQRGTLGGGCVEAEVKQRALRLLSDPQPSEPRPSGSESEPLPQLLTFNLDDDYGWDDGLICGGRMSIVALPIFDLRFAIESQSTATYLQKFRTLAEEGKGCAEAVLLTPTDGAPAGSRFLFDANGSLAGQLHAAQMPEKVKQHLPAVQSRPKASAHAGVAYLPVLPRITLLIVGGGHVGEAVGRLAAECDFDVWVVDDREKYANRKRFPKASRLMVDDIGRTLSKLKPEIDSSAYGIIVTRGHSHDEEALYHLATTKAGYVGMIGSKRKIRLIFDDLLAKGISQETLDRVHAPLGLDIGSQTVPEIAVSIVAELIACRNLPQPSVVRRP